MFEPCPINNPSVHTLILFLLYSIATRIGKGIGGSQFLAIFMIRSFHVEIQQGCGSLLNNSSVPTYLMPSSFPQPIILSILANMISKQTRMHVTDPLSPFRDRGWVIEDFHLSPSCNARDLRWYSVYLITVPGTQTHIIVLYT